MKTLGLVDFSNTLYKSIHVHKHLSHNGVFTGGLYGVVGQLATVVSATKARHVLVCCDRKPYFRKDKFPEYKAGRKSDPEIAKMASVATKQVEGFLEAAGISMWAVKGYEADDLIYTAAYKYRNRFDRVVVRSSDSDLFQMFEIGGRASIEFSRQPGKDYYSKKSFIEEFDAEGLDWAWVTALAGSHNAVPGISGVGIKTAVKILKQGKLVDYFKKYPFIRLNYEVCKLPYDDAILLAPTPSVVPKLRYRTAIKYLQGFGIKLTGAMSSAFDLLGEGGA